jgi:uncharacterized repeat protein (TIGR03803 family)
MQSQKLSIGFVVLLAIFAITILMTVTNATAQADSLSIINADFSAVPIVCALDYAYQATGGGDCSGPIDPQQDFNSAPGFGWTIVPVSPPLGGGTGAGLTDPNSNFFPPSFAGLPFTQAAFLQNNSAALWQTIGGFSAGEAYTLSFYLGSRYYNGGFDGNQTIQALIGDKVIGTWTLTSYTPFTLQRAAFTVSTGGDQVLKFVGLASGDHTAFISSVAITPGPTFTNLFTFDGANGSYPQPSPLVQGIDGNFYGTTSGGGLYDSCMYGTCGTVFKITPDGTLITLHNFDGGTDGSGPMPGLVLATNGDFYGVNSNGGGGDGAAFKITAGGTLTTLLGFNDGADGGNPNSALIQATNGNLYGTDVNGGTHGDGAIFEMTPAGALTTLHDFDFTDGWDPQNAPLVQAADGNLYGTTGGGGTSSNGTVFRITPGGEFTSLHSFNGSDGSGPYGGLVQATDGNLYGTTESGGANNDGTFFKITPAGSVTTLHSFDGTDGSNYKGGLVQAADGNFYGSAFGGGANGYGTIFTITPDGTLTTLHNFDGTDGAHPYGSLLQATNGTFYGTTSYCDLYGTPSGCGCPTLGCGSVFSLSVGLGPFVSFLPATRPVGGVVQILGQGFTGATGVAFNGTAANFTVESDTYLKATVPAGATTGSITVTEPGGTLTSNKIFRVTPQISSFSPVSGPVGTTVVITGNSFTGATEVTFHDQKKATFTVDSDTQITATVPAGAITGVICVWTAGGNADNSTVFTVTP